SNIAGNLLIVWRLNNLHLEDISGNMSEIEAERTRSRLSLNQFQTLAITDHNKMPGPEASRESLSQLTSFSHPRTTSLIQFEEENQLNTTQHMGTELDALIEMLPEGNSKKAFAKEMDGFYSMFKRFTRTSDNKIDWNVIKSPSPEMIVPYSTLPKAEDAMISDALSKLAVLKLNGGLGTTMGCVGPKSAIEVRDGMNFLDLTVRQLEYLNQTRQVSVPLILMNSFNTDHDTRKVIQKYGRNRINIITFNQSRYPRIGKDSLLPVPNTPTDNKECWYPPGHGDVFNAMCHSGLLDEMLAQGKEYVFISNIDNLGATVDTTILKHMIESGTEFIMEVTDKTKADIKGGTLIDYSGGVRLLEIAQVPSEHKNDFTSIKKFKIFNTNNIWISLKAIKRVLEEKRLDLEVIVNHKTMAGTGQKSDLYNLSHGELTPNPKRIFPAVPIVKLGDDFKKVPNFLSRFAGPVHIMELDHLTVTGDVTFGKNVTLKGTVIIVANHGSRIDIPSGSVLEDKVVTGDLRILDH
ncbi:UTP--glucose-1-phosphate uridylyltransferase domain-containing protein, partial [Paramicrosporidium saccamoebae]